MKILIIRNYPSYMDVLNNTYNIQEVGLAKALVRKGNECDILFWTDEEEKEVDVHFEGGKVHVYYRHGKTALKNTVFVSCDSLFEKYDVLQTAEYNQMQSWIMAKKYADKMIIYHGPYYSKFNKRYNFMSFIFDLLFLKRYKRLNTRFMVKSVLAKKYLLSKGIKEKNISVTGVGIDVEMLSTQENIKEIPFVKRMKEDINKKILYIGRLEERRNILFILDVFSLIVKKHPERKLYMIGDGDEGYLKKVWHKVDKLKLRENIIYEKKIKQKYLAEIYKLADYFLLPTHYEIFGMVLLEAMFYRTIVFTTENGGSSSLIEDGINGYIFNDYDPEIWVNKMEELEQDDDWVEMNKTNASVQVSENYLWDSISNRFIQAYECMLENN